jgi:sulfoquinovosyltransferase
VEAAAAQVRALAGDAELRRAVGAAARAETANWDWRAATLHLLHRQYPLAMAAAAVAYGPRMRAAVDAAAAAASAPGAARTEPGAPALAPA